jgi:hypothetical protein
VRCLAGGEGVLVIQAEMEGSIPVSLDVEWREVRDFEGDWKWALCSDPGTERPR